MNLAIILTIIASLTMSCLPPKSEESVALESRDRALVNSDDRPHYYLSVVSDYKKNSLYVDNATKKLVQDSVALMCEETAPDSVPFQSPQCFKSAIFYSCHQMCKIPVRSPPAWDLNKFNIEMVEAKQGCVIRVTKNTYHVAKTKVTNACRGRGIKAIPYKEPNCVEVRGYVHCYQMCLVPKEQKRVVAR